MCRILFHIPAEIGGIPVFGPVVDGAVTRGPSLLLGVWVLFSVGLLVWLVWRQGFNADTRSYLPLLLLVGAIIWWLLPAVCEPGGFPIRGFGVMLLLAVVAGTGLLLWRAHRAGLDTDLILSLAFWMFVPGIVGARIFYVIEYWHSQYSPVWQENGPGAVLAAVINVTEGGLVAYAAFIGGMLGMLAFVYRHRLPLMATCDLIAPCIMLGLAFGRIGCLMNGCCFGDTCDYPWAVTFPADEWPHTPAYKAQAQRGQMYGFRLSRNPTAAPVVLRVDPESPAGRAGLVAGDRLEQISGYEIKSAGNAHWVLWRLFSQEKPVVLKVEGRKPITLAAVPPPPRSLPVHPTQVYSSINALLLCLLLLAYEPFRRRDGELFALMLSIYPIARFLLEKIRTDEPDVWITGMTISQNISLVLLICAAGLWFYILRQPRGTAFAGGAASSVSSSAAREVA